MQQARSYSKHESTIPKSTTNKQFQSIKDAKAGTFDGPIKTSYLRSNSSSKSRVPAKAESKSNAPSVRSSHDFKNGATSTGSTFLKRDQSGHRQQSHRSSSRDKKVPAAVAPTAKSSTLSSNTLTQLLKESTTKTTTATGKQDFSRPASTSRREERHIEAS